MASKLGVTALYVTPTQDREWGVLWPPEPHRIAATVSRQEILIIWTHIYLWSLSSKLGLVFYRQFTEREFRSVINGIDAPIVTCQFCCLVQPLNSTLLNRELRTQVSDTMSASSLYTIINKQYHFMTFSDRFPVPVSLVRSVVKSNFTNWYAEEYLIVVMFVNKEQSYIATRDE